MFARGSGPVTAHPGEAPDARIGPPRGRPPPLSSRPPPPPTYGYAQAPPYPSPRILQSPGLATYPTGPPPPQHAPVPSTSRVQYGAAGAYPAGPEAGSPFGARPVLSVEDAIHQILPPNELGRAMLPRSASSSSLRAQPPAPGAHPPSRAQSVDVGIPYGAQGQYMGSPLGMDGRPLEGNRPVASSEAAEGARMGAGSRAGDVEMAGTGAGYEAAPQGGSKQPPGSPEPDHRHLFHSYILDYFQKQGFHAAAYAFLQDVPDTPVHLLPGQLHSTQAKSRISSRESDAIKSSPRYTNGLGLAKADDLQSPLDLPNRPHSSGFGTTDSITSTTSSSSHFGFPLKPDTASPSCSPSSNNRLLPLASVQIESPQGFLFEWWTVFWDVFRAKARGGGSLSARSFVELSSAAVEAVLLAEERGGLSDRDAIARQQAGRPGVPQPTSPIHQLSQAYAAREYEQAAYPPGAQGRPPGMLAPGERPPPNPAQARQQQHEHERAAIQAHVQAQAAARVAQQLQHDRLQAAGGVPPGLMPNGASIPGPAMLQRRGGLSPLPIAANVSPQQQLLAEQAQAQAHERLFRQQQHEHELARQGQSPRPHPSQQLPPGQANFDPAYQAHLAARQQVAQQRYQPAQAHAQAQAHAHAQAQAQSGQIPVQMRVVSRPSSAIGSPHPGMVPHPGMSEPGTPYSQQPPTPGQNGVSLDVLASPSKRFKLIPPNIAVERPRLQHSMSVPVYPMQMGANPYATAGQNGASPYALAGASPSIDATSPYAHDQRFQPPPQAYAPGMPPQGYQRPHSAIGMYSQESPVLEYPGSSGAPSAPLTGQLARQQQQQPPLPPSPSIVIASAAKRKRDAKDAREAKKRATTTTTTARDRANSTSSTVQAPTPSSTAVTPRNAQDYDVSPAALIDLSPRPPQQLPSAGSTESYSQGVGVGLPSAALHSEGRQPSATGMTNEEMEKMFAASTDVGNEQDFDFNTYMSFPTFDPSAFDIPTAEA